MSAAREEILGRVRAAAAGGAAGVSQPRAYRERGVLGRDEVVARFVDRVEEYGGTVVETTEPVSALAELLAGQRIGIAPDLARELRPIGVELVVDAMLPAAELDALDGALTQCGAACAETGTIALTGGPGEGRRALTLVPDLHVCVLARDQIVETVPELFAILEPLARQGRPLVLVSGPSATSDIELERVEGVHGPRSLVVVLTA